MKGKTDNVTYTVFDQSALNSLEFGPKAKKPRSRYREAAEYLSSREGEGKILRFDSVKCKASLKTAASNMNIRLLFAEEDGKLYVKYGGQSSTDKTGLSAAIRQVLSASPMTSTEILQHVVSNGYDRRISISTVTALLSGMRSSGVCSRDEATGKWRLVTEAAHA